MMQQEERDQTNERIGLEEYWRTGVNGRMVSRMHPIGRTDKTER